MTGNDQQNQAAAPKTKQQPAQQTNTNDTPPLTPAPRYHASEEATFLAQRASQMAKDIAAKRMDDPGLPDSAAPANLADAKFVPLPAGGIAALADHLYPGDVGNVEAMAVHVFDLLTLNRDRVRDDTSSTVGTMVRIP